MRPTDVRIVDVELFLMPVLTRMPLKFGAESLDSVICGRGKVTVEKSGGSRGIGWGETPLSVQWVWPNALPYQLRLDRLMEFSKSFSAKVATSKPSGHAVKIGVELIEHFLTERLLISLPVT